MRFTFKFSFLLFFFSLISLRGFSQAADINEILREEFAEPPSSSWPKVYWWWLNGNIDTERIQEEIKAMNTAGISGFDIFEIGAPPSDKIIPTGDKPFMGDEFMKAVKVALDQAKELDMEVGLNLASSWNAGGAWITPQYASKSIYFSKVPYTGKGMEVSFPRLVRIKTEGKIQLKEDQNEVVIPRRADGKPEFYKEIAVIAIPSGVEKNELRDDQIIDVTSYFDPEKEVLNWKSSGKYDIYRYICSNSGEFLKIPSKSSNGFIIDHFDSRATEFHFNYIIKRLQQYVGQDISKSSLKSLYLASYEALGSVWTESLPEKFEELHGYSLSKYLPIVFDKTLFTPEIYKKAKRDLQYTLSELMIDNFYRKAKEISNAHGLKINSESGGPGFPLHNVPVEPLKSLGVMDLPRGEFWINHNRLNEDGIDVLRVVKEASAASHIYGNNIVEEEAFTTFQHWQEGPAEMKAMGDRAFCEGMNRVVVHGSSHNPSDIGEPGIAYFAGTHYNDKRIWWPMVRPFNQYLSRISNVFQKTSFKADVLYFYGSAVPNFTGSKNGRFHVGAGYDYEVTNSEILLKTRVENGELVLPTGARFKVLALEAEEDIEPEVLMHLRNLASKGAKIVGKKPIKVLERTLLGKEEMSTKDIDALWSDSKSLSDGAGKVFGQLTAIEVLHKMGIGPDLDYADKDFNTLDYIHYTKEGSDYYLVRNTTSEWVSRQCSFRVGDKTPEIWNPVTGEIVPVSIFESKAGYTEFPLSLPPNGSYLIVFPVKKGKEAFLSSLGNIPPRIEYTSKGTFALNQEKVKLENNVEVYNYLRSQPLEGAWEVFFPMKKEPEVRAIFSELKSWSESDNEDIKYFSGIAKYVKTFQMDPNFSTASKQRHYLDLGDLSNVAEVWLNGQNLGVTWTLPHRFDVTEVIHAGDNLLEVKVANTWNNRLKGDAVTGEQNTFTNVLVTDINGLNKTDVAWKDVPLLKSGLFGPVKVVSQVPID